MKVFVDHITVPAGSTLGYGDGKDAAGEPVRFAGDHRPMRDLGELLAVSDEPIGIEIETWQVI